MYYVEYTVLQPLGKLSDELFIYFTFFAFISGPVWFRINSRSINLLDVLWDFFNGKSTYCKTCIYRGQQCS